MKTYYINLDRSHARRDWMESQLSELKLDYERIPAVDGANLSKQELKSKVDRKRMYWYSPRRLNPAQVGCFLSHRDAWKKIAAGQDRYAVVMEDDILISRKGMTLLKEESWIPEQTAFIRLEQQEEVYLLRRYKKFQLNGTQISLFNFERGYGTGAYIIHKSMAEWFILNSNKVYQVVDEYMIDRELFSCNRPPPLSQEGSLMHRAQVFPALVIQQYQCEQNQFLPVEAELSLIDPNKRFKLPNDTTRLTLGKKLSREMRRFIDSKHLRKQLEDLPFICFRIRKRIYRESDSIAGKKSEQVPFLK